MYRIFSRYCFQWKIHEFPTWSSGDGRWKLQPTEFGGPDNQLLEIKLA
jgi:hypothetical protein